MKALLAAIASLAIIGCANKPSIIGDGITHSYALKLAADSKWTKKLSQEFCKSKFKVIVPQQTGTLDSSSMATFNLSDDEANQFVFKARFDVESSKVVLQIDHTNGRSELLPESFSIEKPFEITTELHANLTMSLATGLAHDLESKEQQKDQRLVEVLLEFMPKRLEVESHNIRVEIPELEVTLGCTIDGK